MPSIASFFTPRQPQRPRLALELAPGGVVAAQVGSAHFTGFPAGALVPSLKVPNLLDASTVVGAMRTALDSLNTRERSLTLIVPDGAARVLLLDFDSLPAKTRDTLPILRFRLRKLVPFEVEDAAISYQTMAQTATQTRVLVCVMPQAVRAEYEAAVREAGYEPGALVPSTLAALPVLPADKPAFLVNRNGASVTTAITQAEELLLHRTLELPASDALHHEELRQTVDVALAYYEDTLSSAPDTLYYSGPGTAAEFARLLGESYTIGVRDAVTSATLGAVASIPGGLLAPVAGALAG